MALPIFPPHGGGAGAGPFRLLSKGAGGAREGLRGSADLRPCSPSPTRGRGRPSRTMRAPRRRSRCGGPGQRAQLLPRRVRPLLQRRNIAQRLRTGSRSVRARCPFCELDPDSSRSLGSSASPPLELRRMTGRCRRGGGRAPSSFTPRSQQLAVSVICLSWHVLAHRRPTSETMAVTSVTPGGAVLRTAPAGTGCGVVVEEVIGQVEPCWRAGPHDDTAAAATRA